MAQQLDLVISKENGYSSYNRSKHKYLFNVCDELSKIYNNKKVFVVPSGMASINTILNILNIKNGWLPQNIVYGNELYCDTPRTIKYMNSCYTKNLLFEVDISNDQEVLNTFNTKIDKKLPTILFIESCSNPSGYIFNFDLIKDLRANNEKLTIIVDNTWVSGYVFNPFNFDIDYTVVSLTKYYSAGNCIAGAIIGKQDDPIMDEIRNFICVYGLHVSPYNCKIVFDNIKTIQKRINASYNLTLNVAQFLSDNNINVRFVGLPNHKSNNHLIKFFNNKGPSVLTFTVNMSKKDTISWLKKEQYFPFETSFGSGHSKFDPWPQKETNKKTRVRFSIGYNDNYENIVQKLSQMLNINKSSAFQMDKKTLEI